MVGERLEADALGRALDLEPALRDADDPGRLELEHARGAFATSAAPFAENESGSKPFRSVKRHDSSDVVGIGSAR